MSRYSIIEVSDICIRAYENGEQVYAEPGIALLPANTTPVIGYDAQKVIRQQPTRIHSRFWSDLSTTPLSITQTRMRHGADLIWHQLNQIKSCLTSNEVVFCLSSHLGNAQMQLLAGICESLDLKAHFFLNLGLSQLANHAGGIASSITHLDLQLHQLILSKFSNRDGKLEFSSQETVPGISYLQLVDRMVHSLRDQFIQVSRFDPLHSGDTEQQLFDQVARSISSPHLKPIEISTGSQTYRIEPTAKDFEHVIDILEEALGKLIPEQDQRAYSPVFSHLPGFTNHGDSDLNLEVNDCIEGAETLISRQGDTSGGILYISSMQNGSRQAEIPGDIKENPNNEPAAGNNWANALLYNGKVYPAARLSDLMHIIDAPEGSLQINGHGICGNEETLVNGSQCPSGQAFTANDEVIINRARMMAVQLLE